jgi:threonine aldolase
MMGGAMRQIGHLAAAGLYALDHNLERLAEDHANARAIADRLAADPRFAVDPGAVRTNIVIFHLQPGAVDAVTFCRRAGERGVLVFPFGPRTVRAVTHLDVTRPQCGRAAEIFTEIAET